MATKYFGGVWSNLVFNTGSAVSQLASGIRWRYPQKQDDLKYVSQSAYKSVFVHIAKQITMSTLEGELNSLFPKFEKYISDKRREAVLKQQKKNRSVLIAKGKASTEEFGKINISIVSGSGMLEDKDGKAKASITQHTLIAKTKYGRPVPEALILSYEMDDKEPPITITDTYITGNPTTSYRLKEKNTLKKLWDPRNEYEIDDAQVDELSYETRTVFHIDLAPQVSMNSNKNVVLTQVQGRDYTRKELVSGGDLTYSVSGNIVSDEEGVYPAEAVKRFIKIMQHNGIINVNFITFGLLGVKRIIIKDFSLGAIVCKNMQPYSFTCVAVEPDDAIQLQNDTISVINQQIAQSSTDAWYKVILDNKLANMAAKTVLNVAAGAGSSSAGAGLDALTKNI